ncbi:hypothetical protein [Leptothrix ochracea]|uniref:hypothetical protein n=1 Tax=Leptothrix ochracea TaxID=735331 RepID=UPI0034E2D4D1
MRISWQTMLLNEWRLLTFRSMAVDWRREGSAYLALGLGLTALAGVGRFWDQPHASLWQQLGGVSVAYVFFMAGLLWALLLPLRPTQSYQQVLIFVTLTAPAAFLYAIPWAHLVATETAQAAQSWTLLIVATWRVALLGVFLRRAVKLSTLQLGVALVLPLVLLMDSLSALGVLPAVVAQMNGHGNSPTQFMPGQPAGDVLLGLTWLAYALSAVVIPAYGRLIWLSRVRTTKG